MKRWAFMKGGVIDMIVEQETEPQVFGKWVECPIHVGPGWLYNGTNFSPPPPPPPVEN